MSSALHRCFVFVSTLLVVALCCPLSQLKAQSPIPPGSDAESRIRKQKQELDRKSRELADEYIDVLRQLQEVTKDYDKYLSDSKYDLVKQYLPDFRRLQKGLNDGTYAANQKLLAEQLTRHVEELKKIETEIVESQTHYSAQLYKLIRSLRRELIGVNDLLEEDVATQLEGNEALRKAIQAYVAAAVASLNVDVSKDENGRTVISVISRDSTDEDEEEESTSSSGKSGSTSTRTSRSTSRSLRKPTQVVRVPEIPPFTQGPTGVYIVPGIDDQAIAHGYSATKEDSIEIGSAGAIISIANRLGHVSIEGSDDDMVRAEWSFVVQGNSRADEKSFVNEAPLRLSRTGNNYTVSSLLEQPGRENIRVLRSDITVLVPKRNKVIIDNSFGGVEVSDLENGLGGSTTYSSVSLSDIRGGVDLSCSMGKLAVENVTGLISLKNAYAVIEVSECDGPMKLQNAYAGVSVEDSQGDVVIKNSGTTSVSDHKGNIQVENSLGPVDIARVEGNLTVANRFQSISVSEIDGTVNLDGANAQINIQKVLGGLTIVNNYGSVEAENITGPLNIDSRNCSISLTLNEELHGPSQVNASFGNITLSVSESLDLLVKATARPGRISSSLPMELIQNQMRSQGTVKLGRARESLTLDAVNATILINGE